MTEAAASKDSTVSTIPTGIVGRIVVIEDGAHIAELIRDQLQLLGHTVTIANSGKDGIERVVKDGADLILLDLNLPDMDGFTICSKIKENISCRSIPVIFLTADKSPEAKFKARIECAADDFMTKPVENWLEFHSWIVGYVKLGKERRKTQASKDILRVGDFLAVDKKRHEVVFKGRTFTDIPAAHFKVLCEFASRPREILHRQYFLDRVWHGIGSDRKVDKIINHLVTQLGDGAEKLFVAVYGEGYYLADRLD